MRAAGGPSTSVAAPSLTYVTHGVWIGLGVGPRPRVDIMTLHLDPPPEPRPSEEILRRDPLPPPDDLYAMRIWR